MNSWKKQCRLVIAFFLLLGCSTQPNQEIKKASPIEKDCPLPTQRGKLYGSLANQDYASQIQSKIDLLLSDLCQGHLAHLPEMVDKDLGLFIDAKALWTKEEVIRDLQDKKGYFQTYFIDTELLNQKKGSTGNQTIRDLIFLSGGIILDFYFESAKECEVRFQFSENPKLARRLINPIFAKFGDDWVLMRLF